MIVLLCLPVTSSYASIIKSFDVTGELIADEALPGYTIPLTGSLVYVDPDPTQDNLLFFDAVISLDLNTLVFDPLHIPYIPPDPQFGAEVSILEKGNMILVDLSAYNDFEFSGSEVSGANRWSIGNNFLRVDNGHGEGIQGDVVWTRVPEPSILLLFSAGMAVLIFRRLSNNVTNRGRAYLQPNAQ